MIMDWSHKLNGTINLLHFFVYLVTKIFKRCSLVEWTWCVRYYKILTLSWLLYLESKFISQNKLYKMQWEVCDTIVRIQNINTHIIFDQMNIYYLPLKKHKLTKKLKINI